MDRQPTSAIRKSARIKAGVRRLAGYGSGIISRMLSNAALGGIALVTAREVTTALRGQFLVGLAISGILAIVATFGINISARQGLRAQPIAQYSLGTYLVASSLLSVVGALAAPLPFLAVLGREATVWSDAGAIGIYCGTLTMSVLAVEGVHAINRHAIGEAYDAIGSIIGLLVMIGYLTVSSTPTLAGMLVSVTLGNIVQISICIAILTFEADFLTASKDEMKRLFAASRGNHGTIVGGALLIKGDRYVIGITLGPTAVSLYATAATISELIWLPAQGLANYFYSAARSRQTLERATRLVFVSLAFGAVAIGVFASAIVGTLFGSAYAPSVHLVWVLLPGSIAMTVYFLDSARLMGEGRGYETRRQLVWPLLILLIGTSVIAWWLGLTAAAASCSMAYILLTISTRRATSIGRHQRCAK